MVDIWHFAGHGTDSGLSSTPSVTLGLMDASGNSTLVPRETIVSLAASASQNKGGKLRLVFLNACSSGDLGRQLITDAWIPHVVCWDSEADDGAALAFAKGFWLAIARGDAVEGAFHAGKLAIETVINRTSGAAMYKLDMDPAFFPTGSLPDGRVPAGLPTLLTSSTRPVSSLPFPTPLPPLEPGLVPQPLPMQQHNDQQRQRCHDREDEDMQQALALSLLDRQPLESHSSSSSSHNHSGAWTCGVCTFINNIGPKTGTDTGNGTGTPLCAMCSAVQSRARVGCPAKTHLATSPARMRLIN